ncbi:MAG: ethanolamine ammonia-lyase reactivating factor EutA, partial [Burkholderiales bacterium]|nr:ethanolamine ammonia-lyase reactivating factor EutA [Burkholderiales bacterium]
WLAFMGSCGRASEALGARPILNLDIGGGTTNAALGVAGEVVATGCHFIGAHHLRFQSGTRRLIGLSDHGRDLLAELNVATGPGDLLSESAVGTVIDWYVAGLEAIVTGRRDFFDSPVARSHEQAPVAFDIRSADALIAFSGGVGELLYRHAAGEPLPGTTAYGDLGVDLALGIAASPLLSRDLQRFVPAQRGRATVYGLAMHSAALAGATLFLPDPSALPLRDLPIVARCDAGAEAAQLRAALQLAATHRGGACLQIVDAGGVLGTGAGARQLGERIAAALESGAYPADRSLVLLVSTNAGKALGSYATRWSRLPHRVIVIDEVPARRAHFVHLGSAREGIVPVSFYGIH